MSPSVLFTTLFLLPFTTVKMWSVRTLTYTFMWTGEREEVCAGKEFRLPVYSTSRTVTFTPDSGEPKRVLLENTSVRDPRFELTKGRMLVLREVTKSDQGLYSIKLSSGFAYETLRLKVLDCIVSLKRYYGENFEQHISENASLLEFSPSGAPEEAMPVVLWNRTHLEVTHAGRGRLEQGGELWVAEGVTQADQGDYIVRNASGNVLSHSRLGVLARSFHFSRLVRESINLPLPVPHGILTFIPTKRSDEPEPTFRSGPVQLIHNGQVTNSDVRFRDLISLRGNGSKKEIILTGLKSGHSGLYEIRDRSHNLVSSTVLQVGGQRENTVYTVYAFLRAFSGVLLTLVGLILFLKRFLGCSVSQLTSGLRRKPKPAANPPEVSVQDYSQMSPLPSGCTSDAQQPETPRKWTPRSSPTRTGYSSVTVDTPKAQIQELTRRTDSDSPRYNNASNDEERTISFFVPGSSDCLQSSEECVRFPLRKDKDKAEWGKSQDRFSANPLDENAALDECSVYTSDKLNI